MGVSEPAAGYPPSPWHLHGQIVATAMLVPTGEIGSPPPGTRVVRVFGRALVVAAFFRYEDPSPLTYEELMATVLVRRGWRPRVWIPWIWVDSEASRSGGRDLWAIPKELAEFDVEPSRSHAAHGLGSVVARRWHGLPGRWPVGFRVVQQRGVRSVVTPVSGRVRLQVGRARWSFAGPLAPLHGRRTVVTVRVPRFALTFGR